MEYTKNYLLDKKITIFQPVDGYRASTDAIILSSVIKKIKKGENILDVGSGTGAISLCLAHRFKDIVSQILGLELQEQLCNLSNQSSKENSFENFLQYINFDIRSKINEKSKIKPVSFSHIISNPPYSQSDMPSPNDSKKTAHNHQDFSLKQWIDFCIKMIKPKGFFYMINRAEAVDEILSCIREKLGNIKIIPIYSKEQMDAKRVIIIAQKDNKSASKISKGLIVHNNDGSYTDIANSILRDGAILDF